MVHSQAPAGPTFLGLLCFPGPPRTPPASPESLGQGWDNHLVPWPVTAHRSPGLNTQDSLPQRGWVWLEITEEWVR